jgi:hypothetical protein
VNDPTLTRAWAWTSFLRGHNPILMEDLKGNGGWIAGRAAMGQTRTYANKMNLLAMTPQNGLSSTGYCLANAGQEYLAYQSGSGAFTVNLSAKSYAFEWFNPATGAIAGTGVITAGGGNYTCTPPFSGPAVLWLKAAIASSPTPSPTPTPIPAPIPSGTNNASFVSQSVPTSMSAGQTYSVSVTMRNSGTSTWTAAGGYRLGSQNPQDNRTWGLHRTHLASADAIVPGQSKTFAFSVTAPATAGTYNFQWRMVREYVMWFGAYSSNVGVNVTAPTSSQQTYRASTDFSGTQGSRQWRYLDSTGASLVYDAAAAMWKGSESYLYIWANGCHPGASRDVVRRWTAPQSGSISITGNVRDLGAGGGDGVIAIIRKNGVELKRISIANGNATGVNFSVPTSVAAGNTIDFVINRVGSNSYDSTAFDPTIVLTPIPSASG